MRHLAAIVIAVAASTLCSAQSFEPEGAAFVWRNGRESVRFDKGRFSAGIEGGRSINWHTFLWHDEWIYETLQGGTVAAGPTLQPDGSITMSGAFSARENSAPMKYAMRLIATAQGVRVHMEFEKSAELKLTSGIVQHIFASRQAFTGAEDLWARPSWHATIGAAGEASANRLYVALEGRRSVCLDAGTFRSFSTEGSKDAYVMRYSLVPRDFAVGEKVVAEYTIAFDDMPERFGGEIYPMAQPLAVKVEQGSRPQEVQRYGKLEIPVSVTATYDNPFDPDEVALDATFTAPSGRKVTVPGFYLVSYKREITEGVEAMVPQDNGSWRVRFTPTETGRYTYRLALRDKTGTVSGGDGAFTCVRGGRDVASAGFVRVSKRDPHYFAFDDGRGYYPIGHNLPIYHTSEQLGDEAMRKFAANGENYNRWWMCSYGFGIEWGGKLGWYRQDAAARIDLVMDVAREVGVYYMMCMDTHQDFREGGWDRNPFNVKNGGPCKTAGEWFTDGAARKLYKNRLRYTIARWGYSPNVLCWEFGNEFEGWADTDDAARLAWHREMSDHLRAIDPFGHLITTSFWGNTGPEAYWRLPNIDIVQTHCYTNDDANVAERVREYCLHQYDRYAKPHIFGEFGIRSGAGTESLDPEGWALHNGLWSAATSLCAGGPMPWWHENYIDPLNLYFHFTAIGNFTRDLPLGTAKWAPARVSAPEFVDKSRKVETRDAKIVPTSAWAKPEFNEFTVLPDGFIEGERKPLQLLQGQGHRDLVNPPTFIVNYPQAGRFIVHVGDVSNSGLVRITVDGKQAAEIALPCGEGLGESSVYRPQWKLWETVYNRDITVDIPAGKHRILVENFGNDWVRVTSYTFTGCKVLDKPNLLVTGMQTDGLAVLWLQNRDSDWYNHTKGRVGEVDACRLALSGLRDGTYRVEWWETWKGSVKKTETATAKGGKLTLTLPALTTDVGLRIRAR